MKKSLQGKVLRPLLLCSICLLYINVKAGTQSTLQEELTKRLDSLFIPIIIDNNEEPVPGAKVTVKNSSKFAISDKSGAVELDVKKGDILQISLGGSIIKEYTVGNQMSPVIILSTKSPAVSRNREVKLLNNISTPAHLTATSTQAVYNSDLTKMPVTSVRSALVGRLAGVYTDQSSGAPGADGVSLSLRGKDPLVIIDGVPRNLTVFDLEEIESVTVLKDALSTAMLGVRGNNGALLITTRKGSETKQRISFTAQSAVQRPMNMLKPLGSYDYARLYNEAIQNDPMLNQGITPYSNAALQAYQDGSDPYLYPDVNWMDQVLEPSSRMDRYTLSTSGGGKFAKYFVALEHMNQTGLFKTVDANKYDTNNKFQSYVVRSNIDLHIKENLIGGIHLMGRILGGNEPGRTRGAIFSAFANTPNNAYPVYNADGSYGGTQQFQNNIWAQTIGSGYRLNYKRDVMADVFLKRTLDDLAKGLWIKGSIAFYSTLSETTFREKSFAVFQQNVSPTGTVTYQQFGNNGTQGNSTGIDGQGKSDYVELSLGYDRIFGSHGINAVLLGNRDNSVSGSNMPYTFTGAAGRFAYNFEEKYVAEFAFGLNGSNRYAPAGNTKYGFFPAFGLAWNANKEEFLKNNTWLNHLKLFGSYGKTGWDNPGDFVYNQYFFDGPQFFLGTGASGNFSMNELTLANPGITWEKANKLNLGIEGAVLNNQLGWTVEYYNNRYSDLLMQPGVNSGVVGNDLPDENIGKQQYSGWDFQLNWQQGKNAFNYFVGLNAGIQDNKVLFMDELQVPFNWMQRTGQRVDAQFGYVDGGLYQPGDNLAGYAFVEGYIPQFGDIKYKDLNSDGQINYLDQTQISSTKPLISYGLNLGANWKWLDLSALIQGVENRDIFLSGNTEFEFQNNGLGQVYEHHLNRWTSSNTTGANYPRLTLGNNLNNHASSTYWKKSGDYLRLKHIELGFTIPASLTNRVRLQSARLFVNGVNLFTSSADERIDPEVYGGAYPIQKLINLGINVKL